jgi:Arc/MetJ-type ribon-helix-helix transcriptional regulator
VSSSNTLQNNVYYSEKTIMTLTVRLPDRLEQELAEYCVKRRMTKSDAVKQALEELLRVREAGENDLNHPFIGGDKGNGSDVSGNIKAALRARYRKDRR